MFFGGVRHSYIDADLLTYISGLATPLSADILGKINTFVAGYKSDDGLTNLSDAYDVMYYLGNETAESSLRNLVKRAHDAVAVNSPTFTPYEGWAGDGISSYIDTNYNPATEADNYKLNDASMMFYSRAAGGTNRDMGNSLTNRIQAIYSGNSCYYQLNGNGASTTVIADSLGMFICAGNDGSNKTYYYKNKTPIHSRTAAQTAIPSGNITLLKVAVSYTTRQQAFAACGKYLTQTSVNHITDRFEALMDSNGRGVIP